MIYLRGCEGEMCEWMDCDRYFPSVPFVVLTVDQFVGRGGGPLDWLKQDSHFFSENWTITSDSSKKPGSSLQLSLRKWQKGIAVRKAAQFLKILVIMFPPIM